jgi:hypothetical protein
VVEDAGVTRGEGGWLLHIWSVGRHEGGGGGRRQSLLADDEKTTTAAAAAATVAPALLVLGLIWFTKIHVPHHECPCHRVTVSPACVHPPEFTHCL